ncbi:MAG: bifunctional methylenetetrahydrofolate dehydrogenase/methenyltetrahydrofolate cyclohydrolase FolD [Clostridia bacterium]|nr:bifunctional methylenetetrahydrofolate dehydrogenase/methenyltetrahydrofolate cyclohydrolase FolD [Clostridia bacterium]
MTNESISRAKLIDGKAVSAFVREQIKKEAADFKAKTGRAPGLAVIRVGDDKASGIYVRNKMRACDEVGFDSRTVWLPADCGMDEVLRNIEALGDDPSVDGLLVQLPLPCGCDERAAVLAVPQGKDVDAFHSLDAGRLRLAPGRILPCTPSGIMAMLDYYGIDPSGKECVVVDRSDIVGRPMAAMLLAADATVTVAHSRTRDLGAVTRRADILVSAAGRAGLITADMVKPGAVVIDVGMNRNAEGKLCGDVDFEEVSKVASYITPVPGGVGPMTVTMLLRNTMNAAEEAIAKAK